ncbi:MAG TPA: trypsin-like peptidase domain-containing protein [Polyangiaceae bacterium]|nr:trypsin-like peptidase domain-containing protein [Polyangiaceae bacterium]
MTRSARGAFGIYLACQLLIGCAPAAAEPEPDLQSLCQRSSKLQDVELYDGRLGVPTAFVNRHRLAVGLLRWKSDLGARYLDQAGNVSGQGWCSGTLIDDDLFLTAGHCLDSDDSGAWQLPREKAGIPLSPAQLAREFTVEFRREVAADSHAVGKGDTVEVLRLEEYRLQGVDYAILRLSDHPGLRNGVTRISPSDARPGSTIAILQHPAALPMKVGAGPVAHVQDSKIFYDAIDTLGGSSGAGILEASTGKLVGIHTNGGCTRSGDGENFGVTIAALIAASPMIRDRVDRSRDLLVGDWNGDGLSDLAVFNQGCLYPDINHDGAPDTGYEVCPVEPNADQYFVGTWRSGQPNGLGWRRRNCVFLDIAPKQPLCFEPGPFELVIADWNGDGTSDLGIRRGPCIDFDTDFDGVPDRLGYCYGNGAAEDEYLVGNWQGGPTASIAVRRGNAVFLDVDRNGQEDEVPRVYGNGGAEDQYLVGDWDGDGDADLAVRKNTFCRMNHDPAAGRDDEGRPYRDFWSEQ